MNEATEHEKQIAELRAWKQYAEGLGLRIGLCKSSDCPEGRLAHDLAEGSELKRMFDEWSHSIGFSQRKEDTARLLVLIRDVLEPLSISGAETHDHYKLMARRLVDEQINPFLDAARGVQPAAKEQDLSCVRHDKLNCSECYGGFNPPAAKQESAPEWLDPNSPAIQQIKSKSDAEFERGEVHDSLQEGAPATEQKINISGACYSGEHSKCSVAKICECECHKHWKAEKRNDCWGIVLPNGQFIDGLHDICVAHNATPSLAQELGLCEFNSHILHPEVTGVGGCKNWRPSAPSPAQEQPKPEQNQIAQLQGAWNEMSELLGVKCWPMQQPRFCMEAVQALLTAQEKPEASVEEIAITASRAVHGAMQGRLMPQNYLWHEWRTVEKVIARALAASSPSEDTKRTIDGIWTPWYLDTCNLREVIVKDCRGNTVHYEDFGGIPDEWPSHRREEFIREAHQNAHAMVRWSELAIAAMSSPSVTPEEKL